MGAAESKLENEVENLKINSEKEVGETLEVAEALGYDVIVAEESDKTFQFVNFTENEDQVKFSDEDENQGEDEADDTADDKADDKAEDKAEDENKIQKGAFEICEPHKSNPVNKQIILYWHARMCTKPQSVGIWNCLVPNCSLMKFFIRHVKYCTSPTTCIVPLCGTMKSYFDNQNFSLDSDDLYPYFSVADGDCRKTPAEWRLQQIKYFCETVLTFSDSKSDTYIVEYLDIYAGIIEADIYREAKTKSDYYGNLSIHISKMIESVVGWKRSFREDSEAE